MASGGGGEQGTEMVDISDEQLSRMRGQPEPFPNATSNPMLAAAAEEDDDGGTDNTPWNFALLVLLGVAAGFVLPICGCLGCACPTNCKVRSC